MEKFKSFITEAKEEPYKLVILSHDDPLLAEFSGMYMEDKGKDQLVYSFPVDDDGKVELPGMKDDAEYDKPFRINPENTLVMARGIGSTVKTGNLSWRVACLNLESQGYTLINPVICHDICNDKWYNQIVFQQNDIRTPNTVLVRHWCYLD